MNVRALEELLFDAFPSENAENWDHVGLSVGDPEAEVGRVMVTLDATAANVREAATRGADVLLTHHPVYLAAPALIAPVPSRAVAQSAAAAFEAARLGVSLIAMHTNLDRAPEARSILPRMLGAEAFGSWEHPDDDAAPGLGALARTGPTTLAALARRCAETFDMQPRVWGDPEAPVEMLATLGGSMGSLGERALAAGVQAIVCGEGGYHVCQDLAARGCGIVLLGHDVSEIPFVELLRLVLARSGMDGERIIIHTEQRQWWTPEERAADEHR